jgi:hypothetical protein
MFELHVVVAAVVMLNILELIMEIVPNYPIGRSRRASTNSYSRRPNSLSADFLMELLLTGVQSAVQ